MKKLIKKILCRLNGRDYEKEYYSLRRLYDLSEFIGRNGYFFLNKRKIPCTVVGVVTRYRYDDYLIINYNTKSGDFVCEAEIPRSSFRMSY
jgi:hypothetical protein